MAVHAYEAPDALPGYHPVRGRYAWSVFGVLFALMVVDYVDRQVVVSMFSHLKAQWDLSDSQLGALVSVVSVTVALGAVPLSLLADRWSRVKSIFLMALIWSLATFACAFADSYAQLFAARSVVGLGEAAYGTVGAAPCWPRCFRRACAARCSGRSSRPACWDPCSAWSSVASSPSTGDGRPDSAPWAFRACSWRCCSS